MKICTLTIHKSTPCRIEAILRTLQRKGHTITNSNNADIWFVDCIWPHAIETPVIEEMIAFKGHIVLMSLGDLNIFKLDGLPDELIDKIAAFAKIQWDNDTTIYDPRILAKAITVHPFLIGGLPQPADKNPQACFFGLPTGEQDARNNLRIRTCHILKNQPWFVGGIVGQEEGAKQRNIEGIEVGRRPRQFYLRTINKSLLSICMPGNSPLTYRMFESLGLGSAVVSCDLGSVLWRNRMIPEQNYLRVEDDLSDLVEVCQWGINNPTHILRLANRGYDLYNEYYRLLPDGSMTDVMWQDISNQFKRLGVL